MGVCWMVGTIVGSIAHRLVDQEIAEYKQARPVPPNLAEQVLAEGANGPDTTRREQAQA